MRVSATRTAAILAALVGTASSGAVASDARPLTEACEVALALSAAPARVRADASAWVLGPSGYRKAVEGKGPFTCIVERNHPDSIIPQCADAAGADTVVRGIIFRSERVLAGATPAQAQEEFLKRAAAGEFSAPARPGVNYMASNYNYIYTDGAKALRKVPPHVMFYAPDMENAQIGGSLDDALSNLGMPFVFQEHNPHGYMVAFLQQPSESDQVEKACAGQLGAPPPPAFAGAP